MEINWWVTTGFTRLKKGYFNVITGQAWMLTSLLT
jgi:hypothetical protein